MRKLILRVGRYTYLLHPNAISNVTTALEALTNASLGKVFPHAL